LSKLWWSWVFEFGWSSETWSHKLPEDDSVGVLRETKDGTDSEQRGDCNQKVKSSINGGGIEAQKNNNQKKHRSY